MLHVKNEKGIALVTALMFTLIAMAIIMTLLYSISQGTKVSAANKRYKTALEASYGATELVAKDVLPALFKDYTSASRMVTFPDNFPLVPIGIPSAACFDQKTKKNTALWDTGLCSADDKTSDASVHPDMTFTLKATDDPTGYRITTKIVDTRCGGDPALGQKCTNSSSAGIAGLYDGSGVTTLSSSQGMIGVQRKPAYYRIEVQGERASNPRERSQLSVLYAY